MIRGKVLLVHISPRQLIEARRHGVDRAVDLAHLRRRFAATPGPESATAEQRALAQKLRRLKTELAAAFGAVACCTRCARRLSPPAGRWSGGRCCGSVTTGGAFTADDLRALRYGGVRAGGLPLPPIDHAGCTFRGATGCSLEPADRPSACLVFVCDDLRAELDARPDGAAVEALRLELSATFDQFRRSVGAEAGPVGCPWPVPAPAALRHDRRP